MGDISEHFNRSEFACKGTNCCGGSHPVDQGLVDSLEHLRGIALRPIIVTSGFRCRRHNIEIGGEEDSYHTLAMAADIKCPGLTPEELAEMAEDVAVFRHGGIGIYPSWVHLDVRNTGAARWRR